MTELERDIGWGYPVDIARSFSLFRKGNGDPAYVVDGSWIWRTTRMLTGPVTWRVRQSSVASAHLDAWGDGAEELLDSFPTWLPDDSFTRHRPQHPVIADAQRRFAGLRTPATGRILEALMAGVLEQKVVGRDAFAAWRQLLNKFGEPAPGPTPTSMRVLPTASQWADIDSWHWHQAGVDPRRARTARMAAQYGDRLETLASHGDRDAVYRAMRSIPGVGAWTVAEVASRALGDHDAVSWGDYHLANTVGIGLRGQRVSETDVPEILEPYRPFRGRVVRLLELSPHTSPQRRGPRMSRINYRDI